MRRYWRCLLALATLILPASAPAQETNLPTAASILQKVLETSKHEHANDRSFRTSYSYLRTRTNRELDSKGQVKKEETKQSRNNPVVRSVSFVQPAPVVAGLVQTNADAQSPRAAVRRPEARPVAATQNGQNRAFEKSDFILNEDLLNRFDFTLLKREALNGRDALLIDFKPADKKLPNRNFKDRFINKAAGTIWVDEGDYMLAKIDLHLTDSVNVVGGLVGAVKKLNYSFVRERTEDGLWYPKDVRWRMEGRELLSRKILEFEETRSEVKKVK
jgi:hypothetical protein